MPAVLSDGDARRRAPDADNFWCYVHEQSIDVCERTSVLGCASVCDALVGPIEPLAEEIAAYAVRRGCGVTPSAARILAIVFRELKVAGKL